LSETSSLSSMLVATFRQVSSEAEMKTDIEIKEIARKYSNKWQQELVSLEEVIEDAIREALSGDE
jgi:hypothetical protein